MACSPTSSLTWKNRDVLVTTIAAMIGAAITAVAHFLQFSWLFGGEDEDNPLGIAGTIAAILYRSDRGDDPASSPSRASANILADATAAEFPRRGTPARLCARLAASVESGRSRRGEPRDGLALYREPPVRGQGWLLVLTHPPMEARIERLRAIDRAAGTSGSSLSPSRPVH